MAAQPGRLATMPASKYGSWLAIVTCGSAVDCMAGGTIYTGPPSIFGQSSEAVTLASTDGGMTWVLRPEAEWTRQSAVCHLPDSS
jgi:hypothetical protein